MTALRLSIKDQIALVRNEAGIPVLQFAPFVDAGAVWNVTDNPIMNFYQVKGFYLV